MGSQASWLRTHPLPWVSCLIQTWELSLRNQSIAIYPDLARCQLRLDPPPAGPLLTMAAPTLEMNGHSPRFISGETVEPKLTCPDSHLPSGEPRCRIHTFSNNLRKGYSFTSYALNDVVSIVPTSLGGGIAWHIAVTRWELTHRCPLHTKKDRMGGLSSFDKLWGSNVASPGTHAEDNQLRPTSECRGY